MLWETSEFTLVISIDVVQFCKFTVNHTPPTTHGCGRGHYLRDWVWQVKPFNTICLRQDTCLLGVRKSISCQMLKSKMCSKVPRKHLVTSVQKMQEADFWCIIWWWNEQWWRGQRHISILELGTFLDSLTIGARQPVGWRFNMSKRKSMWKIRS